LIRLQDPVLVDAHPELDAMIQSNLGAALVLTGQLDAAADALSQVASMRQVEGMEFPLIDALGHGALLAAWRGHLREAADLAGRAVRLNSAAGLLPGRCPAAAAEVALAYVHTERYDLERARQHAARADDCDPVAQDPLPVVLLALARARICHAGGDLPGALSILDGAGIGGLPRWLDDSLGLEKVSLLVADGHSARSLELARQLSEPEERDAALLRAGEPSISPGTDVPDLSLRADRAAVSARVETLLLAAVAHLKAGTQADAVRELDHALRLAAPEQLRRIFRNAPTDVRVLLERHDVLRLRHAWLTDPRVGGTAKAIATPRPRFRAGDATARPEPVTLFEALTEKESEVLGHLSELLTTEEIGAVMFISVNTVRTHVRNILRKLSVSRRNEAVRRARAIGLIPNRDW
jgi:LuxR family maltose regulon positive regulatory protein